jgi:DNA-binding MarR family transcriptional regulator|tara:strand:- start:36 stop:404 length:369 start_codon:yes stop_codon:yes gene_type:complete
MERGTDPWKDQLTDSQMHKLFKCMKKFMMFDPEMPLQLQLTFLYIASHDGCHKQAMEAALGYSNAAGSRNTDYLAEIHRYKEKAGLNLISKERDPSNLRRYQLVLTKQGKALIDDLKETLYD